MPLVAPADRTRSRPFRILDGASETGPRLGGRAPASIADAALSSNAVYVLTIPLVTAPDLELSVFVQDELWDAMNAGPQTDARIAVVVAPPSRRRADDRFRSPLSEHAIVLGDEQDDREPSGSIRADHKLGGSPFCIQEPELPGADELFARGYVQLLQLDFPSARDGAISGNWPFADGMFNLFGPSVPPYGPFVWTFQK